MFKIDKKTMISKFYHSLNQLHKIIKMIRLRRFRWNDNLVSLWVFKDLKSISQTFLPADKYFKVKKILKNLIKYWWVHF